MPDEHGHRGHYETYFRARSWPVAPELRLAQLPGLAGVDEETLHARQRAVSEAARKHPHCPSGREAARLAGAGKRLVVETGCHLSHGAIVAREFALPTAANLPGIMGCVRDGDEVDGTTGQVRRIAP